MNFVYNYSRAFNLNLTPMPILMTKESLLNTFLYDSPVFSAVLEEMGTAKIKDFYYIINNGVEKKEERIFFFFVPVFPNYQNIWRASDVIVHSLPSMNFTCY